MDIKMYIVVNNDLPMRKGKICAQVGHMVELLTTEIFKEIYFLSNKDLMDKYLSWKNNGSAKIVLKANETKLRELLTNNNSRYIIDEGRTQIEPNSLTVIGFIFDEHITELVKDLQLL